MSSDVTVTTIDLLRHGECEGGEIFRGSTDVALTDMGLSQMQDAIRQEPTWDQLISSPLQRCKVFSEQLSQQQDIELAVYDELQEIHFGDWEGVEMSVIQQRYQTTLQAYWANPVGNTPPNGESIIDFHQRVTHRFGKSIEQYIGKHFLIITHGAVIRVLMCELLNMPLSSISNIAIPYACLTRFKYYSMPGKEPWVQLCFHRGK